jgi:uncharacterized protein YdeI (YjbR/CyaY-like superfamily)
MPTPKPNLPIKPFITSAAFHQWLTTHHAQSPGLWIRFYKKASKKKSITYPEALDIALCHGWIDGQLKPFDALSWLRKFTPRRPTSNWSKINTQHAARLIASGHMTPAGLAHITAAQADGRWSTAYDSQSNTAPPADFLHLLAKNKKAETFFHTLNQANRYAITYRLQTAKKPETRARRLNLILDMLTNEKKFHP